MVLSYFFLLGSAIHTTTPESLPMCSLSYCTFHLALTQSKVKSAGLSATLIVYPYKTYRMCTTKNRNAYALKKFLYKNLYAQLHGFTCPVTTHKWSVHPCKSYISKSEHMSVLFIFEWGSTDNGEDDSKIEKRECKVKVLSEIKTKGHNYLYLNLKIEALG